MLVLKAISIITPGLFNDGVQAQDFMPGKHSTTWAITSGFSFDFSKLCSFKQNARAAPESIFLQWSKSILLTLQKKIVNMAGRKKAWPIGRHMARQTFSGKGNYLSWFKLIIESIYRTIVKPKQEQMPHKLMEDQNQKYTLQVKSSIYSQNSF